MTGAGRRRLVLPLLLLALVAACSDHRAPLPLDLPSARERTFAEKRDFVVAGYFDPPLAHPGNVRIELYRGTSARGTPVRRIESHVDPATGTTPRGALDLLYANGQAWGPAGPVTDPDEIVMTPDLVAVPGGIESPWNKAVVTNAVPARASSARRGDLHGDRARPGRGRRAGRGRGGVVLALHRAVRGGGAGEGMLP